MRKKNKNKTMNHCMSVLFIGYCSLIDRSFSAQIIKLNDPRKIHGKQRIWWNRRGMK